MIMPCDRGVSLPTLAPLRRGFLRVVPFAGAETDSSPWPFQSHSLGNRYVANHNADFSCVFNAAVGSQSHSPEQDSCYKFRDRWISVSLPPPAAFRQKFSGPYPALGLLARDVVLAGLAL